MWNQLTAGPTIWHIMEFQLHVKREKTLSMYFELNYTHQSCMNYSENFSNKVYSYWYLRLQYFFPK